MSNKEPRGLGRGLGAILGDSAGLDQLRKPIGYVNKEIVSNRTQPEGSADVVRIPAGMIEPNPFQPRMSFDTEALEELTSSIRSLGLIQPITVRRTDEGKYQIISGERRFRACKAAGMDFIPAFIRAASDQGMLEMAIVENIQREDLDPIEVALGYRRLIEECNLTQEQMAARIGKKRASVTNYLRLLKLPAKVQHDLKVGLVSVGHAKVILGVEDPLLQEQLCDMVVKGGLSVRQLEDRVRRLERGDEARDPEYGQELPDDYFRVLEHIGKYFEQDISLKRSADGKGTMTIRFNSDAEVQRFLKALDDAHI
ncbi:MAG: ParB/RepB/Spo0J family partition protein [Bacteroidales bacterium]|nr:ParB/RepB/Spo0J family partition protein [Bacteroidales bacterium]